MHKQRRGDGFVSRKNEAGFTIAGMLAGAVAGAKTGSGIDCNKTIQNNI